MYLLNWSTIYYMNSGTQDSMVVDYPVERRLQGTYVQDSSECDRRNRIVSGAFRIQLRHKPYPLLAGRKWGHRPMDRARNEWRELGTMRLATHYLGHAHHSRMLK